MSPVVDQYAVLAYKEALAVMRRSARFFPTIDVAARTRAVAHALIRMLLPDARQFAVGACVAVLKQVYHPVLSSFVCVIRRSILTRYKSSKLYTLRLYYRLLIMFGPSVECMALDMSNLQQGFVTT